MLKINNYFLHHIKENQKLDVKLVDVMTNLNRNENVNFKVDDQGVLRFHDRICIPDNEELKRIILEEGCKTLINPMNY